MKSLKQIAQYLVWTIIAVFLGVFYMRLVLGEIPKEESYNGFGFFLNLFYHYGLVYVGLIIGSIIAVTFIITDVFILRKKLVGNSKPKQIRILALLLIALMVFIIHYFLEKIIDVI